MTEWKDIYYYDFISNEEVDYRGLYKISNDGRIKSLNYRRTGKEKILKNKIDKDGYEFVCLSKNGNNKYLKVHRLVAFLFLENNDKVNKTQINHKDENKSNNNVENLEWCTCKYNNDYGTHKERVIKGNIGKEVSFETRKKLSDVTKGNKNGNSKKVICITTGEIFDCIKYASDKYGIDYTSIGRCCRNEYSHAGKHPVTGELMVWKYVTNI